jgi:NTE family protein
MGYKMSRTVVPARPASYDQKVALVLQGGGALGSYQGGVYEVLSQSQYPPDWVAGISIGAINAAIIAGNAPSDRVGRLRGFWERITEPSKQWPNLDLWPLSVWQRRMSSFVTLLSGQPGFFSPRYLLEWCSSRPPLSFYDTGALKQTLLDYVDFDRINLSKDVRLSVGAVNVRTGRFSYFDSAETSIFPEHIMASTALPPGFPPIEIDGEHYWDGGLVSNTPLQHVLDYFPRQSRLTFQVDLFPNHGRLPTNLDEVAERIADIRYSSRTRTNTDAFEQKHAVRFAINELERLLPDEIKATDQGRRLHAYGCVTEMDIVQLVYCPASTLGAAKDYEFSRAMMAAHWDQGNADAAATLKASPWLAPKPADIGVRVFDIAQTIALEKDAKPTAVGAMEAPPVERRPAAS